MPGTDRLWALAFLEVEDLAEKVAGSGDVAGSDRDVIETHVRIPFLARNIRLAE